LLKCFENVLLGIGIGCHVLPAFLSVLDLLDAPLLVAGDPLSRIMFLPAPLEATRLSPCGSRYRS
jgi:hypothetical protein